jgi:hypothetical protein
MQYLVDIEYVIRRIVLLGIHSCSTHDFLLRALFATVYAMPVHVLLGVLGSTVL